MNELPQTDTVSGAPRLIDKDRVWESFSTMENGTASGSSASVSKMVKAARETGTDIIKDLVNPIYSGRIYFSKMET